MPPLHRQTLKLCGKALPKAANEQKFPLCPLLHFGDHDPNIAENLLFSIRASVSSRSNLSIVKTNFLSQIAPVQIS
jgi:hypothetical protein